MSSSFGRMSDDEKQLCDLISTYDTRKLDTTNGRVHLIAKINKKFNVSKFGNNADIATVVVKSNKARMPPPEEIIVISWRWTDELRYNPEDEIKRIESEAREMFPSANWMWWDRCCTGQLNDWQYGDLICASDLYRSCNVYYYPRKTLGSVSQIDLMRRYRIWPLTETLISWKCSLKTYSTLIKTGDDFSEKDACSTILYEYCLMEMMNFKNPKNMFRRLEILSKKHHTDDSFVNKLRDEIDEVFKIHRDIQYHSVACKNCNVIKVKNAVNQESGQPAVNQESDQPAVHQESGQPAVNQESGQPAVHQESKHICFPWHVISDDSTCFESYALFKIKCQRDEFTPVPFNLTRLVLLTKDGRKYIGASDPKDYVISSIALRTVSQNALLDFPISNSKSLAYCIRYLNCTTTTICEDGKAKESFQEYVIGESDDLDDYLLHNGSDKASEFIKILTSKPFLCFPDRDSKFSPKLFGSTMLYSRNGHICAFNNEKFYSLPSARPLQFHSRTKLREPFKKIQKTTDIKTVQYSTQDEIHVVENEVHDHEVEDDEEE